jgi:hypothetical protein
MGNLFFIKLDIGMKTALTVVLNILIASALFPAGAAAVGSNCRDELICKFNERSWSKECRPMYFVPENECKNHLNQSYEIVCTLILKGEEKSHVPCLPDQCGAALTTTRPFLLSSCKRFTMDFQTSHEILHSKPECEEILKTFDCDHHVAQTPGAALSSFKTSYTCISSSPEMTPSQTITR